MAIQFDNSNTGTVTLKPPASGSVALVLPSADGTSGQVISTDGGGNLSFTTAGGNSTTEGLYEMANTISTNYTIGTGNNAISAGPIAIDTGITVTIPTGSVWSIV
jgi:hypothetical protein